MLEILLVIFLGILAGTLTGLFPGIHINLISAILLSLATLPFLTSFPPIILAIFIVAMAITHTFLDFIPSILFGAPEEDSFLSILPGHQLLQKGQAYQALVLTLYGSLTALTIILIFIPIFLFALPVLASYIRPILPFILIFASFYLVFREKEFLISLIAFLLAGFLGLLTLNLPVKEPLLPLLSGLFGLSSLLISVKNKTSLPPQKISPLRGIRIPRKQFLKSSLAAAITAPLCSFLPGIGAGHAAVIASEFHEQDNRSFLFLVGAINTIVMALSFITIFSLGRTRTGAAVAISQLLSSPTPQDLALIIFTILFSGLLAFLLGISLSKYLISKIQKINYTTLSTIIILIILSINLLFSNLLGFLVLLAATSLGIYTILSGAKRINLMGSLLLPTIIFYLTL